MDFRLIAIKFGLHLKMVFIFGRQINISDDLSLLRGYFISLMMDRELNNLTFSDLELKIGKAFKNFEEGYEIVEEFYEGIEEHNLKEYNKRELFSILKI
mgnify:CR=1 FL=1